MPNCDYFVIIAFCSHLILFDQFCSLWTSRNAVDFNIENERFTDGCSRCRYNLGFGNFTTLFAQTTSENCTKVRAARAARLFFRIAFYIPMGVLNKESTHFHASAHNLFSFNAFVLVRHTIKRKLVIIIIIIIIKFKKVIIR